MADDETTPTAAEAPDPATTSLDEDITRLMDGLGQHGVNINLNMIDLDNLRARVEAVTAIRLLVVKGICTDDEVKVACQEELKTILAALLQVIEEQALKAASAIVPVRQPVKIARLHD